jgi:hypothetical protein
VHVLLRLLVQLHLPGLIRRPILRLLARGGHRRLVLPPPLMQLIHPLLGALQRLQHPAQRPTVGRRRIVHIRQRRDH